jgi:glycosyltransferase involved in cell wall biosynthesis
VQFEQASKPSVAVVIPAYNEAEGIVGFTEEIDRTLTPHVSALRIIVVDDASTDDSVALLEELRPQLGGTLEVLVNPVNRGHGASVLAGYRRSLSHDPDYVLQVDGDGQFHGSDLRRVLVLLIDGAHAVSGVRRYRQDPWFRMVMTRLLRTYVHISFGVSARDPNCPLRGYEARLLSDLLAVLPEECLIPNLYLTVVAARHGLALLEVDVSHRVRRGSSLFGSSWGRSPVPMPLVRFSLAALRESRSFHAQMDIPGWAR